MTVMINTEVPQRCLGQLLLFFVAHFLQNYRRNLLQGEADEKNSL